MDGRDDTFETEAAFITRLGGGVVRYVTKAVDYGLDEARDTAMVTRRLCEEEGRRIRMIVDIRALRSLSREARLFHQSEEQAMHASAAAFVIDGGISRVIGNFAISLNRGSIPLRLFTDEQGAHAWLSAIED